MRASQILRRSKESEVLLLVVMYAELKRSYIRAPSFTMSASEYDRQLKITKIRLENQPGVWSCFARHEPSFKIRARWLPKAVRAGPGFTLCMDAWKSLLSPCVEC
jgi:hypothetical protein